MSGQPVRIQRSRAKGWRMPENTVYVGRPTKWGNQYSSDNVKRDVFNYKMRCLGMKQIAADRFNELRGKNLACWCPLDQPCHADVLLELANKGDSP